KENQLQLYRQPLAALPAGALHRIRPRAAAKTYRRAERTLGALVQPGLSGPTAGALTVAGEHQR
ncbi:MAG: hypothetical protein ACHQE6_06220, partial [Solirubrobacterales bacterium]